MAGGDYFNSHERGSIDETIRKAEQLSRIEFSVFVGKAEGEPREFATKLHRSLVAPSRSILILVDPGARALEVVTGDWVRRKITDHEVELAVAEMKSAFASDDLVGGLRRGVTFLAEHGRTPQTLHSAEG